MCSDTNCWGFRLPYARTGGVLIFAHRRLKHTDTIFYVVRQIRLHPRERFILLDIEIHGRRLHLLQWQQGCCHCSSLYSHVLSLSLLFTLSLLSNNCLFYRHFMVRQDPQNEALIMLHYLQSGSGVFAHNNGNFLTIRSYDFPKTQKVRACIIYQE